MSRNNRKVKAKKKTDAYLAAHMAGGKHHVPKYRKEVKLLYLFLIKDGPAYYRQLPPSWDEILKAISGELRILRIQGIIVEEMTGRNGWAMVGSGA